MITLDGYSKDPSVVPEGIAVTFGKDMVEAGGGLRPFIAYFLECMGDEQMWWNHRCKNKPKHDIVYVYIIVCNRVAFRCMFGGYHTGATSVSDAAGNIRTVEWPRIILVGPVVRAPFKIIRRGFQGFRYTTQLF